MSNYVFSYYGEPKFESAEEGAKYQAKWQAWIRSIGEALTNPGAPLGLTRTVSSKGITAKVESPRLTGFSMFKASSMEDAIAMAKTCPHLEHGTVDVSEAMEMGM